MPQIRCPNCGMTINLENRKDTDFALILKALKNKERGFSELLRLTGLPRKTLSLRLSELREMNAIVKDKLYYLSEDGPHMELERKLMKRDLKLFATKKTLALFLLFCIGFPVTTHVFATIFLQLPPPPEPEPIGYYRATVTVSNVSDVYGWQVGLRINSTNLKVIDVNSGSFLAEVQQDIDFAYADNTPDGVEFVGNTLFLHTLIEGSERENGILVICQTLLGSDTPVRKENGTLAIIEFGYYYIYQEPELIFNDSDAYTTGLAKMDTSEIPVDENTVKLHFS